MTDTKVTLKTPKSAPLIDNVTGELTPEGVRTQQLIARKMGNIFRWFALQCEAMDQRSEQIAQELEQNVVSVEGRAGSDGVESPQLDSGEETVSSGSSADSQVRPDDNETESVDSGLAI